MFRLARELGDRKAANVLATGADLREWTEPPADHAFAREFLQRLAKRYGRPELTLDESYACSRLEVSSAGSSGCWLNSTAKRSWPRCSVPSAAL